MGSVAFQLARYQIPGDDAARLTIYQHYVHQLATAVHGYGACRYLPVERAVSPQEALLPREPLGVEGSRYLHPAKRAVLYGATLLPGKGNAHRGEVVYHIVAHLGSPVDVPLARAEIAPLEHVVEQAVDAVIVILVVFGRIDPPLGSHRVRPTRGILVAENLHVIPQLPEGRGGASTREACTHHYDIQSFPVGRIHQFELRLMAIPLLG